MAQLSLKRIKIDEANSTVVIASVIAAFIVIFSLVTAKTLLNQYHYQVLVIHAKREAAALLNSDIVAISKLDSAYKAFISTPQNVLGGNPLGTGQSDGSNAKIILDALPSKYDFPGLISSLGNTLDGQGYTINSRAGTDQELTQQAPSANGSPVQVKMPFQINATGPYASIENLINTLQLSIRPIVVQTLSLSGSDSSLNASVTAYTYYQPEKDFTITTEVVK